MVKTKPKAPESIDKITKLEISSVDKQDKIASLEKTCEKNKKLIDEFKEREKATARALVLYERKIKYLKQTAIDSLLLLSKQIEKTKQNLGLTCENILNPETKQNLNFNIGKLDEFSEKLFEVCNELEKNAKITNEERAFISNKPTKTLPANSQSKNTDVNSRFDRLKEEFNQKIGTSVLRKPGRPKKDEQSIVADIGINRKPSKSSRESAEAKEKLNKIFYEAPSSAKANSSIPKTSDSLFDFDEALNPNISLKDIMADLLEEKDETHVKSYSKVPQAEGKNLDFDSLEKRRQRAKMLEAGVFQIPIFHEKKEVKEEKVEEEKKPTSSFEHRFMPFKNIMDETK